MPDIADLPRDYPFGNRVSESLAEHAKRIGISRGAMRNRADRGTVPIIQSGPKKKREVNLYAIYMDAHQKGVRYTLAANKEER
ncbi:DNA-binding protein [Lelliottia sp. WB101]|nr:DNA-binding protein [Lelliottia sp. WB101]